MGRRKSKEKKQVIAVKYSEKRKDILVKHYGAELPNLMRRYLDAMVIGVIAQDKDDRNKELLKTILKETFYVKEDERSDAREITENAIETQD